MTLQEIAFIATNLITFIYLGAWAYFRGITKSISITFRRFKNYKHRWLYTAYMWGFSITMAMAADAVFFFIAAGLMCICGITAGRSPGKMTSKVHVYTAIGGIVAGFIGVVVHFNMLPLAAVGSAVTMIMVKKQIKNVTYWAEVASFATIDLAILIHLLTTV